MLKVGQPAIWRMKEIDVPVVIESVAGEHNGETYYFVKGTSNEITGVTGVPESELRQETPFNFNELIQQIKDAAASLLR